MTERKSNPDPVYRVDDTPVPTRFGRYRVERELGRGAMGRVYLAEDSQLGRKVAIKIPRRASLDEPEALERFYREARITSTLQHPNICPVYDVGCIDGVHYLTMAYIPGKPVSSFIGKGKLPAARQVALLIRKIALALDEAHQKGVVHRDLKPANIMLNDRGEPVVMDFGLALQMDTGENSRLTQSGSILGTPAYMAPEQVRGEINQIGPASDIYALGVIFYQFLTGELPFTGPMMVVCAQILSQQPKRPSEMRPDVDCALEAICMRMMAKEIGQRYGSMREVVTVLTEYIQMVVNEPPEKESTIARKPPQVGWEPQIEGLPQSIGIDEEAERLNRQNSATGLGLANSQSAAWHHRWLLAVSGLIAVLLLNTIVGIGFLLQSKKQSTPVLAKLPQPAVIPENASLTTTTLETENAATLTVTELPESAPPLKVDLKPQQDSPALGDEVELAPTEDFLHDTPADTPPTAIAPFGEAKAVNYQEAWAKHLGVPVDYTNSIGMKFRLIPPGEFLMGSTDTDLEKARSHVQAVIQGYGSDEQPQHRVTITKPFYFGQHEVTKAQFEIFVASTSYETDAERNGKGGSGFDRQEKKSKKDPSYNWRYIGVEQSANHPVVNVSWNDAIMFCEWLSKRDGNYYELPTEGQWEYACRAGTNSLFPTGDQAKSLIGVANVRDKSYERSHPNRQSNATSFNFDDGYPFNAPVGKFRPNAFGLYDMQGNVWEWCGDWYDQLYYREKQAIDPLGPQAGSQRVIRGGAHDNFSIYLRSAYRDRAEPDNCSSRMGFRVTHQFSIDRSITSSVEAAENTTDKTVNSPPATDMPNYAVTRGSFSAWADPKNPGRRHNYFIIIQIQLPESLQDQRLYSMEDIFGTITGTDGYKQIIRFKPENKVEIKGGTVQFKVLIPGTNKNIRDTINIESKMLKEKQTLVIAF